MNAAPPQARTPDHTIEPIFIERWSPRAFDETTITEAQLLALLEAARWAPSAMNAQPWRFVMALRGEAGFDRIADSLVPNNRTWASKAAALVVFVSVAQVTAADGTTKDSATHAFDTGAAWASFALQARHEGWHTHGMGGFDRAALAAAIHLPAGHAINAVVAIGRIGDPATLPEALQARESPSTRKPLAETVIRGAFPAS